jgi:hypothetical protein
MELLDMVDFANSYFAFITNPRCTLVDPSDKLLAPRVQHSGPCLVSQSFKVLKPGWGGYLILFFITMRCGL